MSVVEAVALVGVGVAAGIVSTVASLASLVSYPALLALGLPPLSANMTNTVALLFTGAGAAAGSRPELAGQGRRVWRLGLITAAGGGAGAALLLVTPAQTFERAAPVLIGVASLLILRPPAPVPPPSASASSEPDSSPPVSSPPVSSPPVSSPPVSSPPVSPSPARRPAERRPALVAALFGVAVYIGYFGAAGGILALAVLTAMLPEPLARTNAIKNVIGSFANGVAAIAFALLGRVDWAMVGPLAAGFLIGGWTGPALVRRMPARLLRVLIALAGLAVAVDLAIAAYR